MERGTIIIGETKQALRDGTTELAVMWEAALLPERVCEGGGCYSAHPTSKVWEVRTWLRHKSAPGYSWGEVASSHNKSSNLEEAVSKATQPTIDKYRRSGLLK